AIRYRKNLGRVDLLEYVRTRPIVQIGIEVRIIVVLHAVMFVPQTVIERESRRHSPTILGIDRPVLVTVAAVEGWLIEREGQRAGWSSDRRRSCRTRVRSSKARQLTGRIHGFLEIR